MSHPTSPAPNALIYRATPSILADADKLAWKTAYLSGLIAPETAACLSVLLKEKTSRSTSDQSLNTPQQESIDFFRTLSESNLDRRHRVTAVLLRHYYLLSASRYNPKISALKDTWHNFELLELHPNLWSLEAGLSRKEKSYLSFRSKNKIELNQQCSSSIFQFIEFMLETCLEEAEHITRAFTRRNLRTTVQNIFTNNERLHNEGVKPSTAPALLNLLIQGFLPYSEFDKFTGLSAQGARAECLLLLKLGIISESPSKPGWIVPALPSWFAHHILPALNGHTKN